MQIEIDSLTRCFHNANKARCCFTVFFLLIYCCTLACIIISTKESRAGILAGICGTKSQSPLFPRGGVWLLVIVHTNATCDFFSSWSRSVLGGCLSREHPNWKAQPVRRIYCM